MVMVPQIKSIKVEDEKKKTKKTEQVVEQPKFTKDQVLSSKRYKHQYDVVNTLLNKGESYTLDEVDTLIENYLRKAR